MKTQQEIEQLAEKYYPPYPDGIITDEIRLLREGFIKGCRCQEDMAKLTFVPGLDKETLDELFDLHDDDDFIHEDSDKKYTEEDMRKLYAYAKTPDVVFYKKNGSKELHSTDLENYLKIINKQD